MMAKIKSPRFSIDLLGLKKVGKGALIAMIGAGLTYSTEHFGEIDFGEYTPLAMAVFSVLANFLRKYISQY